MKIKCENCGNEEMQSLLNNGGYICPKCGYIEKPKFNVFANVQIGTDEMCRKFDIGDIVKHFKREYMTENDDPNKHLYIIRGFAKHTENNEDLVIYQALYSPFETYARPYDLFISKVDKQKYPNIKQKFRLEKYYQ